MRHSLGGRGEIIIGVADDVGLEFIMGDMVGYMLTLNTYGTWLQGKEKGYVKDGVVYGEKISLEKDCLKKMKGPPIRLGHREKLIVREAIIEAAKHFEQRILAIAVQSNHVHVVCKYVKTPIGVVVGYYKNAARVALQKNGFVGRVWGRGYDKRYCFDEASIAARIAYVQRHGE